MNFKSIERLSIEFVYRNMNPYYTKEKPLVNFYRMKHNYVNCLSSDRWSSTGVLLGCFVFCRSGILELRSASEDGFFFEIWKEELVMEVFTWRRSLVGLWSLIDVFDTLHEVVAYETCQILEKFANVANLFNNLKLRIIWNVDFRRLVLDYWGCVAR